MTRLFFGGSFNPIHNGHLIVARAVAEAKGFDGVVLVPSAVPPHKRQAASLAEPAQRVRMCQIVAAGDPFFEVSDLEVGRSGPSFTIDTVRQLKSAGASTITWLIGADMLADLPNWYRTQELLREASFLVARRPGFDIHWEALPPLFHSLKGQVVDAPLIEISASEIRQRVGQKRSVRYLTPDPVIEYIEREVLYR